MEGKTEAQGGGKDGGKGADHVLDCRSLLETENVAWSSAEWLWCGWL